MNKKYKLRISKHTEGISKKNYQQARKNFGSDSHISKLSDRKLIAKISFEILASIIDI